ncbi:leucine-rich repeat extensin-like protein 5 [Oryza glaberrima]|uniref:leucine-rich repeat extensin-like protein 5 n=1 Tax=Oryza glaberrima TaxID=4538 RepID=UPI00224C1FC4|nr:leucine-rich repeat extensin-like protein 5 [Oryza glaberrima]
MTTKNCCPSAVPCTALHRELLATSRCLHPRAPSLPQVAASCCTPSATPSRTASALPIRAAPHDADHRACATARPSSPATPQSRRFRTTPHSGPQSAVPAPESSTGNPFLTQAWPPRTRIVPLGRGALFSRALSFSVAPSRSVAPGPPSRCAVPHSPPAPSPPPPRTPALRSSSTSRTRNWSKTTRGHLLTGMFYSIKNTA